LTTATIHAGVFANNKLPRRASKRTFIIVNDDPSYKNGSHWCALYVDENGLGYFFDSFGQPPRKTHVRFLKENCRYWNYNAKQLQDQSSTLCGNYCVLFLLNFALGYCVDDFMKMFTSDTSLNDVICEEIFQMYFS
jgi:hypothetical protein